MLRSKKKTNRKNEEWLVAEVAGFFLSPTATLLTKKQPTVSTIDLEALAESSYYQTDCLGHSLKGLSIQVIADRPHFLCPTPDCVACTFCSRFKET